MSYDDSGLYCYEEEFNSFLAGVFLTTNNIENSRFLNFMCNFEKRYNTSIVGYDDFEISIYVNEGCLYMDASYDDIITINGIEMTVEKYLYSLTSERVRNFFTISSPSEEKTMKTSFLRRILLKAKTGI